jgi:adenylate cyclase
MASEASQRRLAAILSADVVGYSRLMAEDEEATVRRLTGYREEIAVLIRQHRGRVVDAPGDNLLAEFPTATDAVEAATEIQRVIRARNAAVSKLAGWSSGSACTWARRAQRASASTATR